MVMVMVLNSAYTDPLPRYLYLSGAGVHDLPTDRLMAEA